MPVLQGPLARALKLGVHCAGVLLEYGMPDTLFWCKSSAASPRGQSLFTEPQARPTETPCPHPQRNGGILTSLGDSVIRVSLSPGEKGLSPEPPPAQAPPTSPSLLCLLRDPEATDPPSPTPPWDSQHPFFFFPFSLFRVIPVAYGSSQARGRMEAAALGLCHSHRHSHTGSEPCLWTCAPACSNTGSLTR